jgi:large subunit ribosomal protein L22
MVSKDLEKLVRSALANAQQKDPKIDVDRLVISRATVDEGPPNKRMRARSMGRIYRILKKTCHVTIDLAVAEAPGRGPQAAGRR